MMFLKQFVAGILTISLIAGNNIPIFADADVSSIGSQVVESDINQVEKHEFERKVTPSNAERNYEHEDSISVVTPSNAKAEDVDRINNVKVEDVDRINIAKAESVNAQGYTLTYTAGVYEFEDEYYNVLPGTDIPSFSGSYMHPSCSVFVGWRSSIDGRIYPATNPNGYVGIIMPECDLTLTSQWAVDNNGNGQPDEEEKNYLLTYTDGVDTEEIFADEIYPDLLPQTYLPYFGGSLVRAGYVFKGWLSSYDNQVYESTYAIQMPTCDLILTAQWAEDANGNGQPDEEEAKYKLTYSDGVDSEVVFEDEIHNDVYPGTVIPEYNNGTAPTRNGFVFKGWYHSIDKQEYTKLDGLTMPDADLVFTALWEKDANVKPDEQDKPHQDEKPHENDKPNGEGSKDSCSTNNNRNDDLGSGEFNPILNTIDGHWMHVDPNDNFKEIAVPQSADKIPSEAPEYHRWKFILNNGTMIYNRKVYINNPYAGEGQPSGGWFYFDNNGIMRFGWYFENGKWYYLNADSDGMLGARIEGWHFDKQDNRWYYLKPGTGEMLIGWQLIDGKWYYFNTNASEATWSYDTNLSKWMFSGSKHRPYGSMYANEKTPDGYFVGKDGVLVK